MGFERYVEIGRVCLVNFGPDYGKLVTIVDVLDQNRALVDAPDMIRQQYNFKRLSLTDLMVEIPRLPGKKVLKAALATADIANKWAASSWGKKLAMQVKREGMTDFERFKLMVCKVKKSAAIRRHLAPKAAAKAAAPAAKAAKK